MMLVFLRGIEESIHVGDGIDVTVLSVKGEQVRLGIKAPKDVPVHREEIYQEIKNGEAGSAAKANLLDDLQIEEPTFAE